MRDYKEACSACSTLEECKFAIAVKSGQSTSLLIQDFAVAKYCLLVLGKYSQTNIQHDITSQLFASELTNACTVHCARMMLESHLNEVNDSSMVNTSLIESRKSYSALLRKKVTESGKYQPGKTPISQVVKLVKEVVPNGEFSGDELNGIEFEKEGVSFKVETRFIMDENWKTTVFNRVETYFKAGFNNLLLTYAHQTLCVWIKDNVYYFFDPHGMNAKMAIFKDRCAFRHFLLCYYSRADKAVKLPESVGEVDIVPLDFTKVVQKCRHGKDILHCEFCTCPKVTRCAFCKVSTCNCAKGLNCRKNREHLKKHTQLEDAAQIVEDTGAAKLRQTEAEADIEAADIEPSLMTHKEQVSSSEHSEDAPLLDQPVEVELTESYFYKYGKIHSGKSGKCVICPHGKTLSWTFGSACKGCYNFIRTKTLDDVVASIEQFTHSASPTAANESCYDSPSLVEVRSTSRLEKRKKLPKGYDRCRVCSEPKKKFTTHCKPEPISPKSSYSHDSSSSPILTSTPTDSGRVILPRASPPASPILQLPTNPTSVEERPPIFVNMNSYSTIGDDTPDSVYRAVIAASITDTEVVFKKPAIPESLAPTDCLLSTPEASLDPSDVNLATPNLRTRSRSSSVSDAPLDSDLPSLNPHVLIEDWSRQPLPKRIKIHSTCKICQRKSCKIPECSTITELHGCIEECLGPEYVSADPVLQCNLQAEIEDTRGLKHPGWKCVNCKKWKKDCTCSIGSRKALDNFKLNMISDLNALPSSRATHSSSDSFSQENGQLDSCVVIHRKVHLNDGTYYVFGKHSLTAVNNSVLYVSVTVDRKWKNRCPACNKIRCRQYSCKLKYKKKLSESREETLLQRHPLTLIEPVSDDLELTNQVSDDIRMIGRKRANDSTSTCRCDLQALVSCDRCAKRPRLASIGGLEHISATATNNVALPRLVPSLISSPRTVSPVVGNSPDDLPSLSDCQNNLTPIEGSDSLVDINHLFGETTPFEELPSLDEDVTMEDSSSNASNSPAFAVFETYSPDFCNNKRPVHHAFLDATRTKNVESVLNIIEEDVYKPIDLFEDLKKYNVEVSLLEAEECSCCHRIQNPVAPMEFTTVGNNPIMRRAYGDNSVVDAGAEARVCYLCFMYLQGDRSTSNRRSFSYGWPSFIYSMLTDPRFDNNQSDNDKLARIVLKLIDRSVLQQYVKVDYLEQYKELVEAPGLASDLTLRRRLYEEQRSEGTMASIRSMLNRESYATVKCPAGCNSFIDDEFHLVPIHHVLKKLYPAFNQFQADDIHLRGARSDFLKKQKYGPWICRPGTIIDPKKGLCLCVCKNHKTLSTNFVHVPRSPVNGTYDNVAYDPNSTILASANVVRKGTSKPGKNTCFGVVNQRLSLGGISVFSLALDINKDMTYSDVRQALGFVAYHNRDDIKQYIKSGANPLYSSNHYDINGQIQQSCDPPIWPYPSKEKVEECAKTGSYTPTFQVLNLIKMQVDSRNLKRKQEMMDGYNVDVLPYGCSMLPRKPLLSNRSMPRSRDFLILSLLRTIVLHSFNVYRDLYLLSHEDNAPVLLKQFIKSITGEKRNMNKITREIRELARNLENMMLDTVDGYATANHTVAVTKILEYFGLKFKYFESESDAYGADWSTISNECKYVFYSDYEDELQANPPLPDHPSFCFMMSATSAEISDGEYDQSVVARAKPQSQFIHMNSEGVRPVDNIETCMHRLKVYVRSSEVSGLIEGESTNIYGDVRFLKCQTHDEFLVRDFDKNSSVRCRESDCSKPAYWFCSKVHGRSTCNVGICRKHGLRKINLERRQCFIEAPLYLNDQVPEDETESSPPTVPVVSNDNTDPIGNLYCDPYQVCGIQPHTTSGGTEVKTPKTYNTVGLCYLLNHNLGVRGHVNTKVRANRTHHMIQNQIYSRNKGRSECNLFPEYALFPEIFPYGDGEERIGALHAAMLSDYGDKPKGGMASWDDHMRVRLSDDSLLTSKSLNYCAYSHEANVNRLTKDSKHSEVLTRGLEGLSQAVFNKSHAQSEGRPNFEYELLKLSHQQRDVGYWNYFLTLTANTRLTPGLAPLTWAIENYNIYDPNAVKNSFQNSVGIFCRAWCRVVRAVIVDWIYKGPEKPLGDVYSYWYRFESQSGKTVGNLMHVHGGIVLKNKEDFRSLLERTSCRATDFEGHAGSKEELEEKGVFSPDGDGYYRARDNLLRTSVHHCDHIKKKCQKFVDGKSFCRNKRYPYSSCGSFKEKEDLYSKETVEILQRIGLADPVGKVDPRLRAYYFNYANDSQLTKIATNGKLGMLMGSATNVQVCDDRFSTSYCLKYASGKDEYRDIFLKINSSDDRPTIEAKHLYNAKISQCAFSEKKRRQAAKEPAKAQASEIPIADMLWFEHRLPYVETNVQSILISTEAYSCRGGQLRQKNAYKNLIAPGSQQPLNPQDILSIKSRTDLPDHQPWRKFTQHQERQIVDLVESKYVITNLDKFNLRAPELLDVNNPRLYHRWFTVLSKQQGCSLDQRLELSYLLDGTNSCVKVRSQYLEEVIDFYKTLNRLRGARDERVRHMLAVFVGMREKIHSNDSNGCFRFVDFSNPNPVVVVFSKNSPHYADKFLISFLLKHGKYDCEADLFDTTDLRESFVRSNLLDRPSTISSFSTNDVAKLLRIYVLDELMFQAFSSSKIGRYLACAEKVFTNFLLGDSMFSGVPLTLDRAVQAQATHELETLEADNRRNLLNCARRHLPNLPEDITEYRPVFSSVSGQSDASQEEQCKAIEICTRAVDSLLHDSIIHVKSPSLHGAPGCGKTHIMMMMMAYALAKNLRCMTTALTSERAQYLGGTHIHRAFDIEVIKQSEFINYSAMVEKSLVSLARSPKRFCFLKRLDCIFFDELGMINEATLAMIDVILRRVKGVDKPYGGVLLFSSGDNKQIKPIEGKSVWLSNLFLTTHDVLYLQNPVRCAGDARLQYFIQESRMNMRYHDPNLAHLIAVLKAGIPVENFKNDWKDIPDPQVYKIVSTKAAKSAADELFILEKRRAGIESYVAQARDQSRVKNTDDWSNLEFGSALSKVLDERCAYAPREIVIFKDTVYQLTINNNRPTRNSPKFSQGHLVRVTSLPSEDRDFVEGKLLVPTASGEFPSIILKRTKFHEIEHRDRLCRYHLRRETYSLAYYNASTIHKIIGRTIDTKIATKITGKDYRIWDKNMLVVLLSRVRRLSDIYFIGDRQETFENMRSILSTKDNLGDIIESRMKSLNVLERELETRYIHPLPRMFYESMFCVPIEDNIGYVGLVVSVNYPEVFHVVNCESIAHETTILNRANCFGVDAKFAPYSFAIFIHGFQTGQDSINERLTYYLSLKDQFDIAKAGFRNITWEMGVHLFRFLHATFLQRPCQNYTLVQCLPLTTSYEFAFDRFLRDNLDESTYLFVRLYNRLF